MSNNPMQAYSRNAVASQQPDMQAPHATHTANMLMSPQIMGQIQAFAEVMATGRSTVPKHLQGNMGDCMAVTMQAAQWGMNPFAVAQKTHVVSGTLGYEAQLVNAVISSSRAIKGRFKYEYGGDWQKETSRDAWVRVGAVLAGEAEITWGEPLYPHMVTTKNSPLWKTQPKQQAAYLAVKYWSRMYCPDVILGVYTSDELHAQPVPERELNPGAGSPQASSLKNRVRQSADHGAVDTEHEAAAQTDNVGADEAPDFGFEEPGQNAVGGDLQSAIEFMVSGVNDCTNTNELNAWADDIKEFANDNPDVDLTSVRRAFSAKQKSFNGAPTA